MAVYNTLRLFNDYSTLNYVPTGVNVVICNDFHECSATKFGILSATNVMIIFLATLEVKAANFLSFFAKIFF
jgi:hypothetical protein